MADATTWWVIWRESQPDAVDILWIGPQPGPDAFTYTTETPQPPAWAQPLQTHPVASQHAPDDP